MILPASRRGLLLASLLGAATIGVAADGGWPAVGGDAGGMRYSPLDQVTPRNVWQLRRAWTWRHGDLDRFPDRRPFAGFHATPILLPETAGGALVVCTPFNRVVALDPATGAERWQFDPKIQLASAPQRLKCLGVTYWEDTEAPADAACRHRLFSGTNDRRILALDALTGTPCPGFGAGGIVDAWPLFAATEPAPADPWEVQFSAPPVVAAGVLVIGHINNAKNQKARAAAGAIRGFDARTGALRWTFDPSAGVGGANAWSLLSVDEQRGLVFVPTSSASPNWYGGTRPGNNGYANSVVALRADDGTVAWSFQHIHHDVWDWDTPSQPMLVEFPVGGRKVPAVVVLTKQSLVFVLDRQTGRPLVPIEERAVPTDGVAGEQLSPTQPFPVRPPPLMSTRLTPDDAFGLTFLDEAACRQTITGARHGDIYTPPSTTGWIMYPGSAGGMNWGGGAFDPVTGLLVTPLSRIGLYLKLVPQEQVPEAAGFDPTRGAPMGPPAAIAGTPWAIEQRLLLGPTMIPCTKPPWATLVGVDLAAGEIRWTVPLGNISKLSPLSLPLDWGAPISGGPIATGGGLTFIGATGDARLRAFETATGKEVWSTALPASAHANPMTYLADGRQFIVVAAGGHMFINAAGIDDQLVAYAIPPAPAARDAPSPGAQTAPR
ncbi:MAG: pyrroloquinoline quinone-dependent dehydrogenase [Chromatiales bacterium]|nr:pyrroloquinoline quinone-dependent dehydrogenase [Chromatiales bacterium]